MDNYKVAVTGATAESLKDYNGLRAVAVQVKETIGASTNVVIKVSPN